MKYRNFNVDDSVLVTMPQGSGFEHPQQARVLEKGRHGVVLFQKPNGRRWWANSRRIALIDEVKEWYY